MPPRAPKNEADQRKARSMARLRRLKVPVIDHLPVIEGGRLRSEKAIVDRMIALLALTMRAFDAPKQLQADFAAVFKPEAKLSPDEKKFMRARAPNAKDKTRYSWRCEALEVLQWSIGLADKLPKLDAAAVPQRQLERTFSFRSAPGMVRAAERRSHEELLELSDLLYRAHWATRDAQLNGKAPPSALDPDIVMERDHAIRWLVGYAGQPWDEVSCDT